MRVHLGVMKSDFFPCLPYCRSLRCRGRCPCLSVYHTETVSYQRARWLQVARLDQAIPSRPYTMEKPDNNWPGRVTCCLLLEIVTKPRMKFVRLLGKGLASRDQFVSWDQLPTGRSPGPSFLLFRDEWQNASWNYSLSFCGASHLKN